MDLEKFPKSSVCGFTLLELILATAISALVIGILAVCFSFAMRVWQSAQNERPDLTFQVADLLKRQLAECDPTPVKLSDTDTRTLFAGQANSLSFITAHSVKAISQGVPVVAHYTYDPDAKVLSYSELLLDPYHTASIEKFISGRSTGSKAVEINSYGVDFPEFALAYAGKGSKEFSESWNGKDDLPVEVLLRWRGSDSTVHALVCMVNNPFSIEKQQQAPPQGGVGNLNQ